MSWIRSDKALLHHPKTAHLKVLLNAETATVIGRLHMLWWWCLDYAIDGDLSKKEAKVIEDACGVPLKMLIRAGFVDSRPYRRIHDWWDNQGNYLKIRYRDQSDIWLRIKESYTKDLPMGKNMGKASGNTAGKTVNGRTDGRTDGTDVRTSEETSGGARARAGFVASPPPAALAEEKVKSYDEASDNEVCGPPPNWAADLKQKLIEKKLKLKGNL